MISILLIIGTLVSIVAAIAMSLRNVIHSALLLIGSWMGVAMFYLWAGAEFVAFAQVLVYVGAVSMVVLFAVLLTRRQRLDTRSPASRGRAFSAIIVGGAIAGVLIGAVLSSPSLATAPTPPEISVKELGQQLAESHAPAVLIVGVILTVALIGAIVLAAQEKAAERKDESSS